MMMVHYKPRLALFMPWGSGTLGIPHTPAAQLSLSSMSFGDSQRIKRPLYPIRLDNQQRLYVLFELPQAAAPQVRQYHVRRFNPQSELETEFTFPVEASSASMWHILDFTPDQHGGVYLLELIESGGELRYRLRRVNDRGQTLWAKFGAMSPTLDFEHLLGNFAYLLAPTGDALFLPAADPQKGLAKLAADTGVISATYDWDEPSSKLTMPDNEHIYFSRLLIEGNDERSVLIRRNLLTQARQVIESEIQFLHNLAGLDASGNIYPRIFNGFARLSPTGTVAAVQVINGAVASKDHVFISTAATFSGDTLHIEVSEYSANRQQSFNFETQAFSFSDYSPHDLPKLIHVDSAGLFYFYWGETHTTGGHLAVFAADGTLHHKQALAHQNAGGFPTFDQVNSTLLPIETVAGEPSALQVDAAGSIYLPLSDLEGFKIIQFQPTAR